MELSDAARALVAKEKDVFVAFQTAKDGAKNAESWKYYMFKSKKDGAFTDDVFVVDREDFAFFHKLLHRGAIYRYRENREYTTFQDYWSCEDEDEDDRPKLPDNVQAVIFPKRYNMGDQESLKYFGEFTDKDVWFMAMQDASALHQEMVEEKGRKIVVGSTSTCEIGDGEDKVHNFDCMVCQTKVLVNCLFSNNTFTFFDYEDDDKNKVHDPSMVLTAAPHVRDNKKSVHFDGALIRKMKNNGNIIIPNIMSNAAISTIPYVTVLVDDMNEWEKEHEKNPEDDKCPIQDILQNQQASNPRASFKKFKTKAYAKFEMEIDDLTLFCKRVYGQSMILMVSVCVLFFKTAE